MLWMHRHLIFFLEKGYKNSYVTTMAKTLHISIGNLIFWFPTKEHILAEMIKELCAFQAQADAKEADKKGQKEPLRSFVRSGVRQSIYRQRM